MDAPTGKVSVMLAAAGSEVVTYQMQPPFLSDARFVVSATATGWPSFEETLFEMKPMLLVIQAGVAPGPDPLLRALARMQAWNGVALVVLPAALRDMRGVFEQVSAVRGVFVAPVNWGEIAQAGYAAVASEQARSAAAAPLQQAYFGRAATAVTGTRVVAFVSGSGGVGRSTVAENLAYELAVRMSVRTLLMSFDLPPAAVAHLKGRYNPNALEYFRRPGDGFNAALQAREGLDMLMAPDNTEDYLKAGMYSSANKAEADSIYSLVQTAWGRNYAAVMVDLPAGAQAWTLQGILAANTAVIVARPTLSDLAATRHTLILLLERLVSEHRIPREAIYLVLNRVNERSMLTAGQFHSELAASYGWAPPVAAVIADNPAVTQAQDAQAPVVTRVDDFAKGIRSLAAALFPGGPVSAPDGDGSTNMRSLFRLPKIRLT
ncbi:MAG: AAA family ATPase [Chloroflexota bacterium]